MPLWTDIVSEYKQRLEKKKCCVSTSVRLRPSMASLQASRREQEIAFINDGFSINVARSKRR